MAATDSTSAAALPLTSAADRRRRLQRAYAFATVFAPALGTAGAVASALVHGVAPAEWISLGLMYVLTGLGLEAGFHRYFSHRAFRSPRAVTYLLAALGSMAAQGPVLFWAAIHRRHHKATDRDGDPHSPWLHGHGFRRQLMGMWHAHVGWLFQEDSTQWARFTPDLLKDRDIVRANALYPHWLLLGLVIPALGGLLAMGADGGWRCLLWGGFVRIFLLDHVTWAVNSIGHVTGRRPYPRQDHSGNVAWLALPSFGGAWHNNHHAFPASAHTGHRWYQIDLSGLFIEALALLGLARQVNRPRRTSPHTTRAREERNDLP